jgi:hypothetical protein
LAAGSTDPALPAWITPALIASTLTTFQPYYAEVLTDADAVEMLMNVANLYQVLAGIEDDPTQEQKESAAAA